MSPSPSASFYGITVKRILFLTIFFSFMWVTFIYFYFCACMFVCTSMNHAKGGTGYFSDMKMNLSKPKAHK